MKLIDECPSCLLNFVCFLKIPHQFYMSIANVEDKDRFSNQWKAYGMYYVYLNSTL